MAKSLARIIARSEHRDRSIERQEDRMDRMVQDVEDDSGGSGVGLASGLK